MVGVKSLTPDILNNNNTSGDDDTVGRYSSPDERRDSSPENPPSLSSPLKALGISPDTIKTNAKQSKLIKVALVKSIDKYKEIRYRLEAVER
jgi:hypothetical protein